MFALHGAEILCFIQQRVKIVCLVNRIFLAKSRLLCSYVYLCMLLVYVVFLSAFYLL